MKPIRSRSSLLILVGVLALAGAARAAEEIGTPSPAEAKLEPAPATAPPASPAQTSAPTGDKQVGGMSILGDDEAPKALVLVPWKSADLGRAVAVAKGLDAGRDPVDRKSFGRSVDYYEIRAGHER